jgi:hypothetical protein
VATILQRNTSSTQKAAQEDGKARELQGEKKLAEDIWKSLNNNLKNMHTYIEKECIQRYGFVSNSTQAPWKNKINALKTINPDMIDLRQPSDIDCQQEPNGSLD